MMKKAPLFIFGAAIIAASCSTTSPTTPSSANLSNQNDSLSYAIGVSMGGVMKAQGLDSLDADLIALGIRELYSDTAVMTPEDADMYTRVQLQKKQDEKDAAAKAEGMEWLAENGAKEGVVTLPSGLQYKVMEEGTGASPDGNDQVTVHYRGTLLDGTQFDSSYDRGTPATFQLTQVIRGWTEGIPTMKEGGKTMFYIPSDLGYGNRAAPGGAIPANSTLIFEVELISVSPID